MRHLPPILVTIISAWPLIACQLVLLARTISGAGDPSSHQEIQTNQFVGTHDGCTCWGILLLPQADSCTVGDVKVSLMHASISFCSDLLQVITVKSGSRRLQCRDELWSAADERLDNRDEWWSATRHVRRNMHISDGEVPMIIVYTDVKKHGRLACA